MLGMYTSYICNSCKKQLVLLTEEVDSMDKGKYLACPYCNSRHIKKQRTADSVRECMSEHSYKRCNGYIKQRR